MTDDLQRRIDELPTEPGVYVMRDKKGKVIYIGKATNLRARVRSYFHRSGDYRAFVALLEQILGDVEVVVTQNAKEALLLENNLIKKHKPRFNILLKDDKNFLSLRLDTENPWPHLEVVRRMPKDGAQYFGPYHSATSIRRTLRIVNRAFQLRTCTDRAMANRARPCIQYEIKRCPGMCVYDVDRAEYMEHVADVTAFLQGKRTQVVARLRSKMDALANDYEYERAAYVRDQVRAIEASLESQNIVSADPANRDVFGFFRDGPYLCIQVLFQRDGAVIDQRAYSFDDQEFPDDMLLMGFVQLFYEQVEDYPEEVLLPMELEGMDALAEWLSEKRGASVRVSVPERAGRRRLVELANSNARANAEQHKKRPEQIERALERLQKRLHLKRLPRRIECYDISNLQGQLVVGSKVLFVDGKPDRSGYRHFRIKSVDGQDDFASMYEMLSRRLGRLVPSVSPAEGDGDLPPDLIVIDGGKGQLNVARTVMQDLGIVGIDLVSLAKSHVLEATDEKTTRSPERVFLPEAKNPIVLNQRSEEMFVLVQVRDEAHRFAVSYHKKLRGKQNLASALDDVPGIGPRRRRVLLKHFGSLKAVRAAPLDELQGVIGPAAGLAVFRAFHPEPATPIET